MRFRTATAAIALAGVVVLTLAGCSSATHKPGALDRTTATTDTLGFIGTAADALGENTQKPPVSAEINCPSDHGLLVMSHALRSIATLVVSDRQDVALAAITHVFTEEGWPHTTSNGGQVVVFRAPRETNGVSTKDRGTVRIDLAASAASSDPIHVTATSACYA